MRPILEFLMKKPLLVRLILIFILLFSVLSALKIRRLAYPRVDFERLTITTFYPGASPDDVELNVTVKIEEALEEVEGLEKYLSQSRENISKIDVYIDPDENDKEKVKSDIRRAVDRVTDLPPEVEERPIVFEHKMDNYSIFEVALVMPGNSEKEVRRHARALKKRLLDLGPVSRVWERGIREREFRILLDRKKMEQLQVTFDDVISAVKTNKIRASAGFIETAEREKNIVTLSEFTTPGEIEKIVIRTSDFGTYKITVKDVGRVIDDFEKRQEIIRYNGKEGMSLWLSKKSSADIIETIDEIKKLLKEYKKTSAPPSLELFSTFDESRETRSRLSIVYGNAVAGFVLVVMILFLFLHRTIALWTAVGIPTSIGLTLIMMQFFDITINSISLCGMVVVLGLVVDDAIIISESIYRARERGLGIREASVRGLMIVVKPVLGTIVTTIIAFITIYFIPGMIGDFSTEIPSIVIIMLVASFTEATFILPVHLAHSGGRERVRKNHAPPGQKLLNFLEKRYSSFLELVLTRKKTAVSAALGFLILGSLISYKATSFNLFPLDQAYFIWITGNGEPGSSLGAFSRDVREFESIIKELPRGVVLSYRTTISRNFSNSFAIALNLVPAAEREYKAVEVKEFILKNYKKKKTGRLNNINFHIEGGGPPVGKPLVLNIVGNDNKKREEIAAMFRDELKGLHVTDIETDFQKGKEELRIIPRYDLIAVANLNSAAVASTIRTAIDGTIVDYLHTPEEKIPFRVMLDGKWKNYHDPLKGLYVKNPFNRLVPVKSLVKTVKGFSQQNIYHYNGDRSNTISGNVDLSKSSPKRVYNILKERHAGFESRYPGFKLIIGGEAEKSATLFTHLVISIILAVVGIYFILVIQFNSLFQPFMIILAIPFGLVGLMIAFALHGMDISMLALVGILGYAGVVVNDSLIMIDFINRIFQGENIELKGERSKAKKQVAGSEINKAIVRGAVLRLRPILLTTLTTVAGLVPTAYGIIGGIDSFISPMVMAMAWGLLIGTIATLLVIPVFYLTVFNVTLRVKGLSLKLN